MRCLNVFVDVDGTLIDENDNIRPFAFEFMYLLSKVGGINIRVWSGGGVDYAHHHLRRILLSGNINEMISVEVVPKGNELTSRLEPGHCYFIDDEVMLIEHQMKKGSYGYHIPHYDANEDDMELYEVYKDILKFIKENPNG